MSLITVPNTFSAGAVIVASQHNSNFTTITSDYNGNIENVNISASAAIAYSKLTLTGGIVNADVNASAAIVASKLVLTSPGAIGSVAPSTGAFTTLKVGTTNQGDILYDNATSFIRLTPGTSGQFLKTQGAAANPVWATVSQYSNVLFQYEGQVDGTGTNVGEYSGTSLVPAGSTGNYRFLLGEGNNTLTIYTAKLIKFAGLNTVTVYGRIWNRTGSNSTRLAANIGGATGTVDGTSGQHTPEWKTFTVDVSGLSNGTAYDVTFTLKEAAATAVDVYCSNIIGFGS